MAQKLEQQNTGCWMGHDGRLHRRMPFDNNLSIGQPIGYVSTSRTDSGLGQEVAGRLVAGDELRTINASLARFAGLVGDQNPLVIAGIPAIGKADDKSVKIEQLTGIINPVSKPGAELFLNGNRYPLTKYEHDDAFFDVVQNPDVQGSVTVTQVENSFVIDGEGIKTIFLGKYSTKAEKVHTFVVSEADTIYLKQGHSVRVTGKVGRVLGSSGKVIIEKGGFVGGDIPKGIVLENEVHEIAQEDEIGKILVGDGLEKDDALVSVSGALRQRLEHARDLFVALRDKRAADPDVVLATELAKIDTKMFGQLHRLPSARAETSTNGARRTVEVGLADFAVSHHPVPVGEALAVQGDDSHVEQAQAPQVQQEITVDNLAGFTGRPLVFDKQTGVPRVE